MKIKDVTCKILMNISEVNGHENYELEYTDYVKDNWDKMSEEGKKCWYTTSEHTVIPDAEDVLDYIVDRLDSSGCYYDGMEDVASSLVITDENKRKLQDVLNEIFTIDQCKSYSINERVE